MDRGGWWAVYSPCGHKELDMTGHPEHKSSDTGNSNMSKRIPKETVPPLSEKVKVLNWKSKEKKSYAEVAKKDGEDESSIREELHLLSWSCEGKRT